MIIFHVGKIAMPLELDATMTQKIQKEVIGYGMV